MGAFCIVLLCRYMTYEHPPKPILDGTEQFEGHEINPLATTEQLENEAKETKMEAIKIPLSESDEDAIAKLQYDLSINRVIENKITQKPKGDEEGVFYSAPKPRSNFRNAMMAARIGIAGLFGFSATGAKASAELPKDSIKNKIEVSKKTPEDSAKLNKNTVEMKTAGIKTPFEEDATRETFGNITLEGNIYIPFSDTTKEVYAYYFSGEDKIDHKIGSIIEIMEKKGFAPADGKLLHALYDQNKTTPAFNKKTTWLLAPTPESSPDDTRSNEKMISEKDGKIETVIPSNAVFPTKNPQGLGKFEVDQGLSLDDYGIVFVKEKK